MYELHLPLVMLANRSLQRGPGGGANPEQIKADLKVGLAGLMINIQEKSANSIQCGHFM